MAGVGSAMLLLRTLPRLGFANAAEVAVYRARLRTGLIGPLPEIPVAPLFREDLPPTARPADAALAGEAAEIASGHLRAFGGVPRDIGCPPDWFRNVLSGQTWRADTPWWRSHAPVVGDDIKGVWEASRFDWLLVLARAARASGEVGPLRLANDWAADWIARNPVGFGPNWHCGQETAIRLMQTLLAARILGQDRAPAVGLRAFVRAHVARIAQTRRYADAQDNNHATSEAFGLFAGGGFLAASEDGKAAERAAAWSAKGRRWLEDAVARLVFEDGGFSQYSVNYHRVVLETLSQAELWRRWLALSAFSARLYTRAQAATCWLAALTNTVSGDAPNLGSNDGARLYCLHSGPYRDHRPCVQLAAAIFLGQTAYEPGPWDIPLEWAGVAAGPRVASLATKRARWFGDFGLALLNPREDGSGAYAFVKVPRDRFRPSQADPLHFDLWSVDGVNLLRDAGSYSYADAGAMAYFSGIGAHNTVSFDGREPMPRISRFLFGDWIRGETSDIEREGNAISWSGRYRDRNGASHLRSVTARCNEWLIDDEISGNFSSAVLRWRFSPGGATLTGLRFENAHLTLTVEADRGPLGVDLHDVVESRTYCEKSLTPGLEARCGPETRRLRTRILLK